MGEAGLETGLDRLGESLCGGVEAARTFLAESPAESVTGACVRGVFLELTCARAADIVDDASEGLG